MAKIIEGINGGFSGKVGTVVGVRKKGGGYYMRAVPKKKSKRALKQTPQSPARLAARGKFNFLNAWLKQSTDFIRVGFAVQDPALTSMQAAFKRNWPAVKGEFPDFLLDHSKIFISGGKMPPPEQASVIAVNRQILEFTWSYNRLNTELSHDDQCMLFAYFPVIGESRFKIHGSLRSNGKCQFQLSEKFSGQIAEVYLGFRSDDRQRVSDSLYLGQVVIQ